MSMEMKEQSDDFLALSLKSGNWEAAEVLMGKYKDGLFGFICRMTADYHLAEDLFQETWLKVMEKIDRYNPRYPFRIWVFAIARNLCLDSLRKAKRRKAKELWEEEAFETYNDSEAEKEKLRSVLFKISPKLREVVILRFYHQHELKEISDILGVSMGTVKSRLSRGIHSAKKLWSKEAFDET